jgi:hypothetical protein
MDIKYKIAEENLEKLEDGSLKFLLQDDWVGLGEGKILRNCWMGIQCGKIGEFGNFGGC